MNGHHFEANGGLAPPPDQSRSASELSDLHDAAPLDEMGEDEPIGDAIHDMGTSELEEEDDADAPGEVDDDYGEPAIQDVSDGMRHDRSSSDCLRPGKRKSIDDNEPDFEHNPELYGLRRSGRARPTRRLVDSSEEDEDDDDAVNSGRRRKRQKTAGGRPSSTREDFSERPSLDRDTEGDDTYGGQRGRTFAKKQRQLMASGRGTPQLSEVRFSTRRAAKVTNYNEDDNLGLSDEDEDTEMTPAYHYVQEDEGAAIDIVLNHRLKEGADASNPDKHDYEFYIKWQGQAHYHSTWELWATAIACKGKKRLENYYRKIVQTEQAIQDPDTPVEIKEKYNLDREAYLESLNDFMHVERVIGVREDSGETEYFVKWKSLFYDNCTWESQSLVSELAQDQVDRFLNRVSHLPQSDPKETNLNTRSDYRPFRTQPDYIKGGELREFQIHGVNFLAHHWCKGNNVILADEMGLGKTVQTVSFMNWLRHDRRQQGPFIVVVPLSTMPAWADTFNNWAPDINYVVYNGNEAARKIIREYEMLVNGNPRKIKFNVLLTTYEYILADSGFLSSLKWQFMAVDEAHRLKNRESQLYGKLMDFGAPSRLLITGTPMQNTLSELSALMDFLMPGKIHVEENIDLTSEHASKKLAELTDAISPYMIRRTKQKVENDLPPKTEKIIRVELSDVQLEYYKNILTRNYAALNAGSNAQKTSLLNIMMELKKASNHPFMFPNAEERFLEGRDSREDQLKALITTSGKMMLLDQLLTKMRKDGHRVLIFSQMVKMLDILSDYLQLRGYQYQRLDGTIAAGTRRMAIDHFNAPNSQDFCFLLSTRAGGLGINLMTADTVILFDSDWNPQADLQAMARAHRIGQKKPVTIYRLVSKDTVEEEVLERARNKLMLEYITIQRGVTDKDARELGDRMAKAGASVIEPTSSDDISNILKKRGQKMFEQTGNQRKLEELDIEAVLENAEEHKTEQPEGMTTDGGEEFLRSFEYTDVKIDLEWDDIIPKDQLEKIKEEERKREEEAEFERLKEENQPRKRKAPTDEAREQRAAKKRARDLAAEMGAGGESGDDSDSDHRPPGQRRDPKRALGEKECRLLIQAYEKWGSIEERQDELIRSARLIGRDLDVVKTTLQEIIDTAERMMKEQADREVAEEARTGKPVTKKDKKAVLFDFRGVKRNNAETLTERPKEMRLIRDVVEQAADWSQFRVVEASKPASYTCEWGAREDGMLLVGLARHGFGAWPEIRDDPELELGDKMFLEEHRVANKEDRTKEGESKQARSPGAVHLVRRTNYLLSVLKDKISNGTNQAAKRALENHHRNNRKHMGQYHGRLGTPTGGSASPAPGKMRQGDVRASLDRRLPHHGSPNGHLKPRDGRVGHHRTGSSSLSALNGHARRDKPMDETSRRINELLEPIKDDLVRVSGATKKHCPDNEARLLQIKQGLLAIGQHIESQVRKGGFVALEEGMWQYVSDQYWPQSKQEDKKVSGSKLRDMFKKISGKDKAAGGVAAAPKAKPQPVLDANGTSSGTTPDLKPDPKPATSQNTAASNGVVHETKNESAATTANAEADTSDVKMVDAPAIKTEAK